MAIPHRQRDIPAAIPAMINSAFKTAFTTPIQNVTKRHLKNPGQPFIRDPVTL